MQKEIEINNQKISYTLRRSKRARKMRLTIGCDGNMTVTVPSSLFFGQRLAEKVMREKSEWILDKLNYFKKNKKKYFFQNTRGEFLKHKNEALELATKRISYFNIFYGFNFQKISIRSQKTRWGSCSRKGNLNFNYKIALLPEKMADYIIVHELCHLGQFNHSKKFWDLVAKTIPDYKYLKKEIRGA